MPPQGTTGRPLALLLPAVVIGLVCLLLLVVFPIGFPNYDSVYYLLWGKEMAEGMSPDLAPPLVPTPHPLYELFGAVVSPLGDGASTAAMVLAYLSLGALAWLVYRLGSLWFDRPTGVLAAVVIMTSAPILSNGLRAYIDLPYIVLCLAALVVETKRPRAGWPVLLLLALAGLLRPEAWIFSGAYLLYLLFRVEPEAGGKRRIALAGGRIDRRTVGLVLLAASGPIAWLIFDLITTGDLLYSLTGTRENVETLERDTGPVDVVLYGPRRLGEVLQWPGMVGGLIGVVFGLIKLRDRSRLGIAAAVLALLAFALMGSAGLAVIPRYTMLAAAILSVFVALSITGWRLLEPGDPWRRPWQFGAVAVVALFAIWLPNQIDLLKTVDRDLANQGIVERDLEALVDRGAFSPLGEADCLPISVPNHRAVPRLALWLDIRPSRVISAAAEAKEPRTGYFLAPARPRPGAPPGRTAGRAPRTGSLQPG
ncbi:MAG: hypothetical protein ACKOQ5_05215, partial [Solirubrobacterales bacterium]